MTKGDRALEARRRIVLVQGGSELRVLYTRSDGTFDLLWFEVGTNGRDGCSVGTNSRITSAIRTFSIGI